MRRLADIDLLDDEIVQRQMTFSSVLILAIGVLVGVIAGIALPHEELSPLWFVFLLLGSVIALPVHELVHAAAFALLTGFSAHIRFGYKDFMLYTSAAGAVLPRRRFCVVLLAPTILVTCALCGVPAALGFPLLGWFLAVIHIAGCTGDLSLVYVIAHEPRATHVEDTDRGIALFNDVPLR